MTNSTTSGLTLVNRGTPGSVSLLELAHRNSGIRGSVKAISTLMAWATAEAALGRPLGDGSGITAALAEYRAWWHTSERTAWRELESFRKAFPGEESPARIAAQARELRAVKAQQGYAAYAGLQVLA